MSYTHTSYFININGKKIEETYTYVIDEETHALLEVSVIRKVS